MQHKRPIADPDPLTPLCDQLALWLIVALLIFAPLAFGAVHAWSEFVILTGCLGLVGCLIARALMWKSTGGLRWTPTYFPVAAFVMLAFLQISPIPFWLLEWLSPTSAELYADAQQSGFEPSFLSLYPHATWHDLCLVVAAAVVFLTVVNVVRRSGQVKGILLAVAVIGSALAMLALVQGLFSNGHIYWIGPPIAQENSGTFLCHNHFSQHMNLSVVAMLAYAMLRFRETLGRKWLDRSSMADWFTSQELRFTRWLMVFAICGLVAIAVSVSRMGIVSSVAALIMLSLSVSLHKGRRRASIPIIVGLVAVSAVILVGFEAVFDRMATLNSFDSYSKRWTVVTDLVPAFGDFMITGSGLGTFSAVYPMYDTGTVTAFASHAENEYAQLLLEMGIPGAILFIWFLTLLIRSVIRSSRRNDHLIFIVAPALAAGLLAVAIHSWTDFGQHIPAIALLSAAFCGLLIALDLRPHANRRSSDAAIPEAADPGPSLYSRDPAAPAHFRGSLATVAFLGLLLALNLPAGLMRVFAEEYDTVGRELADSLASVRWKGSADEFDRLVSIGEQAVRMDPGNATYRYRLGVYRWQAAVRGRSSQELTKTPTPELTAAAGQIVGEMIEAAGRCPPMGALYCWRGQMEAWVLGLSVGRDHIRKGIQTAKADPIAWSAAAQLSAIDGDADLAYTQLLRCVALRRGMLRHATDVLLKDLQRPDMVLSLAGDDPQKLSEVSSILKEKGYPEQSATARTRALDQFRFIADEQGTPTWALIMLAEDSSASGQHVDSAALYRRALAREYTRLPWRLACVMELIAASKNEEAVLELQICERINAQKRQATIEQQIAVLRRAATTQPALQLPAQPTEPVEPVVPKSGERQPAKPARPTEPSATTA